ncbi:MAG: hypothetical protein GOV15_00140, partial [Candidatus Diapherotrites archaeon]|nr:hypothetical protein [Candidatus Diapherotrites archaeon]
MKRFCPKCGKTEGEPGTEKFIEGFCKKCYLQDHTPLTLPKKIVLNKCKVCGKIRIGRDWQAEEHDNVLNQIQQKIKGDVLVRKQEMQTTEYDPI